jgi:hypothetical protein
MPSRTAPAVQGHHLEPWPIQPRPANHCNRQMQYVLLAEVVWSLVALQPARTASRRIRHRRIVTTGQFFGVLHLS